MIAMIYAFTRNWARNQAQTRAQAMYMGARRGVALDMHPTYAVQNPLPPFSPGGDPAPSPFLAAKAQITPRPPHADDVRLQQIIPSLWVAFAGLPPSSISAGGFTHIIDITHPGSAVHRIPNAYYLPLDLPQSRHWGRPPLALTPTQLFAAIAFICAFLPRALALRPNNGVRFLVIVPPGHATDAMSIVGGYLALLGRRKVDAVLRRIDVDEEVDSMWKGEVSEQEIEQIEGVIRQS